MAADDDAGRVEVVIKGVALAQEFWRENNVFVAVFFADFFGIADRDGRFNNDGGVFMFIGFLIEKFFDDVFDGRGVKIVAGFVVVGWSGDDDEIFVFECGSIVVGGSEVKIFVREKIFNLGVFNRRFFVVDKFNFFRHDFKQSNFVVLSEQRGEAETYVTSTSDGNFH